MDSTKKETILKELYSLVFEEHKQISANFISKQYHIHISEAPKLLEEFVNCNRKDGELKVEYFIDGTASVRDSDDIPLNRYLTVDESDLESSKAMIPNSTSHIYSVSAVIDGKEAKSVLHFEQFIYEPSEENARKVQGLTYLRNSTIKIRPSRSQVPPECIIKYDSFDGASTSTATRKTIETKKEEKMDEECELMECDDDSNTSKPATKAKPEPKDKPAAKAKPEPVKKPAAKPEPKKRLSPPKEETVKEVKRFKRIQIESDSEEDGDDVKMKENIKIPSGDDDAFRVTKVETKENEEEALPKKKPAPPVPNGTKKEPAAKAKPAPKVKPSRGGPQGKQTSIMSFFKKPTAANK